MTAHPRPMADSRSSQRLLSRRPCCTDCREDAASRCVELLVRGTTGAQRELVDAVAAEARVRVAVDEAGDGREPAAVDLLEIGVSGRARDGGQIAHCSDRLDLPVSAEDERVLDHPHVAKARATKRPTASRRGDLREVTDKEPAHGSATAIDTTSDTTHDATIGTTIRPRIGVLTAT